MKINYKNLIYTCCFVGLFACSEDAFELDPYESEIVIDAWIEPNQPCKVLLTLSAPYFSTIDSSNLRDYSLTRAKVTLTCDSISEILTLKPNSDYFPPYIYQSIKMKGEIGKNYDLNVSYGGVEAYAKTSIPEPVDLEKVWFELEDGEDSIGFVHIQFTDNESTKDYYRSLTQTLGKDNSYVATYFPNFNDEFFNGEQVNNALYYGKYAPSNNLDSVYYYLGDTIRLKFCTINKESFDFWISFQKEMTNAGNPFASSNAKVQSNVSNGLGVFCGYGSNYYQIIAQ